MMGNIELFVTVAAAIFAVRYVALELLADGKSVTHTFKKSISILSRLKNRKKNNVERKS